MTAPRVYLLDDDEAVVIGLRRLLTASGFAVEAFTSVAAFLRRASHEGAECLVVDLRMPEASGLEVQAMLGQDSTLAVVFLTGFGDVATSVRAMKDGAVDFLTKPVDAVDLIAAVQRALERSDTVRTRSLERHAVAARVAQLTPREREVCALVIEGRLNKQIASEFGTTEKTVKVHRSRVMQKLGVGSVAELARIMERTAALS